MNNTSRVFFYERVISIVKNRSALRFFNKRVILNVMSWLASFTGNYPSKNATWIVHFQQATRPALNSLQNFKLICLLKIQNLPRNMILPKLPIFFKMHVWIVFIFCRGKSLLELWVTTLLPDWQPPLIFDWLISNFLCMCSNSMASAHVILKSIRQRLRVAVNQEVKW